MIHKGYIKGKIRYKYKTEEIGFSNKILDSGRKFLANLLLNNKDKIHVSHMIFGDGGTENGNPKEISNEQTSIFGVTRLKKPVFAQIDPDNPMRVIFSITIKEDEGNDSVLNEMALELSDGTLFSMATFPNLNKSNLTEIDWEWDSIFI